MKILISKTTVAGASVVTEQYRKELEAMAGTWQTVETEHLFCDQFNLKNLRVHCRHVDDISGDVREGLYKCANTGVQSFNPIDVKENARMQMQRVAGKKNVFFVERNPDRFITPPTTGYAILKAMEEYDVSGVELLHAANMPKGTKLRAQLRRNEFDVRILLAMADFVPVSAFLGLLKVPQHYKAEALGYNGMFASRKNVREVWDYATDGPSEARAFAVTALGVGINTLGRALNLTAEE